MRSSATRRAFLLIVIMLLLGALASNRVAAAPRTDSLPIEQYWQLVESSRQTLADLKGAPAETLRAGLDDLAAQWQIVTGVQLKNGKTVPFDNAFLLSALRAGEPDLIRLTKTIDALLAARDDYPSARFTTENIQPLEEILARPEFQWKEEAPNPINDWFQKLWDRFAAWLDKLFPDREVTASTGPAGGLSIWTVLAILLLALILAYVFRGLFADLVAEAKLNGNGDPADEVLTADAAFQRAQSLSRGRDFRAAVRYLYLSSLLLLDERGLLRYDRTRTNREYLRTISDKPELSQPLSEVIDVFDNVWYGYHELDEERFKHYSDRVEELKEKKG